MSEGTDLFRRPHSLAAVGRFQEALAYSNQIIELAENLSRETDETLSKYALAHAYSSKGMVLRVMNRRTEALQWLEKALKHNPDNTQALFECGFLYI